MNRTVFKAADSGELSMHTRTNLQARAVLTGVANGSLSHPRQTTRPVPPFGPSGLARLRYQDSGKGQPGDPESPCAVPRARSSPHAFGSYLPGWKNPRAAGTFAGRSNRLTPWTGWPGIGIVSRIPVEISDAACQVPLAALERSYVSTRRRPSARVWLQSHSDGFLPLDPCARGRASCGHAS